ncbi:MAG: hypothetical protein MJA83_07400 [Gammaproteobacteria bacterium]|nr:hypothetical protein [Gammaproteobacteria bacterium]
MFAGFIPFLTPAGLMVAGATTLLPYLLVRELRFVDALIALKRVRWLLLTIFIIYAWFTPDPAATSEHVLLPTLQGVLLGVTRCGVICILMLAVNALLLVTSQRDLITGLSQLVSPLKFFGMDSMRFARLVTLSLQRVSELDSQVKDVTREITAGGQWHDRIANLISGIEIQAEQPGEQSMVVRREQGFPNFTDWLPVIVLLIFFLFLMQFNFPS